MIHTDQWRARRTLCWDGTPIPRAQWGGDHWSVLAYVHSVVVNGAAIEPSRMQTNPTRHPLLQGEAQRRSLLPYNPDHCTRLIDPDGVVTYLHEHDDWDCLDELEDAGLVEIVSLINGIVRLTPDGFAVAQALVAHRGQGGSYATFQPWRTGADSAVRIQ